MTLSELSPAELRMLRGQVGEVMQEKIDALLNTEATVVEKRPTMTRPEREMQRILDARKRAGEVEEYWYESVKLKIGAIRCHYTPDFFVRRTGGGMEFIEVKGPYMREDARVKYMSAAREHTWAAWRLMRLVKGEWITVHRAEAA
jgi:hypothetical protein